MSSKKEDGNVKGDIMNETAYPKKEAIEKLTEALEDIKTTKDLTITDEQKERLATLEKAIPKAIKKAKNTKENIKLHKIVESCC